MDKLTKQAVIGRNKSNSAVRWAVIGVISIMFFSMVTIIVAIGTREPSQYVAVVDDTGNITSAQILPINNAEKFHEYLVQAVCIGLYSREEGEPKHSAFDYLATREVLKARERMYEDVKKVHKQKRIIQDPRIMAVSVDNVSNLRIEMRVKLEVTRNAYTITDSRVREVERVNLGLRFEKNTDITSARFVPFKLTEFKEYPQNNEENSTVAD